MRRYNKLLAGASWMGEYGDPDKPEQSAAVRDRAAAVFARWRQIIAELLTADGVSAARARELAVLVRGGASVGVRWHSTVCAPRSFRRTLARRSSEREWKCVAPPLNDLKW